MKFSFQYVRSYVLVFMMGLRALAFVSALTFSACAHKGTGGSALQGHIGQAQTASDQTSRYILDFKGTVDAADYKASRAKKLWQEGVERP